MSVASVRMRVNYSATMQTTDSLEVSTSSSSARLVSSSPPDNFGDVRPCQLLSPSAAVLPVSEEFCVIDAAELPLELEASLPLVRNAGQQTPSPSSASQSTEHNVNDTEEIARHPISSRRRIYTLILAVILLVFGGILIPVSWVTLRKASKSSVRTECYSIATRLQWVIIGQGLLLSLTGVLLLCWNRTIHHHSVQSCGLHQRWCICVFSALVSLSYAVLLVGLSFVTWQLMSSSIYCNWTTTHSLYVVSALTELLAVLLSAASIEIMFMACHKVF